MQRQKVKGTGHKQPADVKTEPNFYAMTPCLKSQESQSPTLTHSQLEGPNALLHNQTVVQTNLLARHSSVPHSTAPNQSLPAESVLVSSPHHPAPRPHVGPAAATAPRPNEFAHSSGTGIGPDLSPGLRGLHSAANLLKGMAAGLPASSLESPFSLGQSAQRGIAGTPVAASPQHPVTNGFTSNQGTLMGNNQNSSGTAHAARPYASIAAQLLLPKDRSNSLLGRVTHIDESLSGGNTSQPTPQQQGGVTQHSAFFWPPTRQQHTNTKPTPPAPTTTIVVEGLSSKDQNKPAATGGREAEAQSASVDASEQPSDEGETEIQKSPDQKPIQALESAIRTSPDNTVDDKKTLESMSQEEAFVEKKVSKKGIETEEA
jgi:hypothetical protein